MVFRTQRDLERSDPAREQGRGVPLRRPLPRPLGSHPAHRQARLRRLVHHGGKRKRITLGAIAGMDLDQARRQATEIVNAGRDGRDPGQERKLARIAAADVLTLGGLIDAYLRYHAERNHRPHTLVDTRRYLERDWAPLHGLSASRRDPARGIGPADRAVALHGHRGCQQGTGKLSACYAWGMKAGLVDHNPTIGTIKSGKLRASGCSRSRAAGDLAGNGRAERHDAIIRLLMLTGAAQGRDRRLGLGRAGSEPTPWCCCPASAPRTAGRIELPLSRQAFAILREFPELPRCPYVFGRGGHAPFSGWIALQGALDARIAEAAGRAAGAWTVHDSAVFATLAAEHGLIEPFHIEAILNHVSGHRNGVAGIYNRALYREQKRRGLQRWADWLEATIEGRAPAANVVALAG